jgi:hypothetical protein
LSTNIGSHKGFAPLSSAAYSQFTGRSENEKTPDIARSAKPNQGKFIISAHLPRATTRVPLP